MPLHSIRIFSTTPAGRLSLPPANDRPTSARPSRLNLRSVPLRYHLITLAAEDDGVIVKVRATFDGVEGPPDVDLGGRVFVSQWAEFPDMTPPIIFPTAGSSSRVEFTFLPAQLGHFLFVMRLQGDPSPTPALDGGAVAIPIVVRRATA